MKRQSNKPSSIHNPYKTNSSETVSKYGKLDIFFANAGVSGGLHMDGITSDSFLRTLKINTISVFLAIKYASTVMKTQGTGGSIIATASVAGIRAGAGGTDYSASKAAVINLVQTSAWQLYKTGIRGTSFDIANKSQRTVSGDNRDGYDGASVGFSEETWHST
jgi:NAD(P)-dependent dehydrogenase (short-subunit alcohol dehydrogenase family)